MNPKDELTPEQVKSTEEYDKMTQKYLDWLNSPEWLKLCERMSYQGFSPDTALTRLLKERGSGWTEEDLFFVLSTTAVKGTITSRILNSLGIAARTKLEAAMKNLGVNLHRKGLKLSKTELNSSRLAAMFPGLMFKILSTLKKKPNIFKVLSPAVLARVPKSLCFLGVASLVCATKDDEEKRILIQIARLVNDDYSKNSAKLGDSRVHTKFLGVIEYQLSPSIRMKEEIIARVDTSVLSAELAKFQ